MTKNQRLKSWCGTMGDRKGKDRRKRTELAIVNEQLQSEIAERHRIEAALRRSEQLLYDFFENATVGMHWVGSDGCILRVNQAQLDLLGYDRDEYSGNSVAEFFVDQAMLETAFQRLLSYESLHHYEVQLRCKDGSIKDVAIDSNVLWEGDTFSHTRSIISRTRLSLRQQAAPSSSRLA